MNKEIAIILDAGAQFSKVIDRKVRELNVESIIMPLETTAAQLQKLTSDYIVAALIISGGPSSVNDEDAPKYDEAIFELGLPILGICYGMQMINHHFGGTVEAKDHREDGQQMIKIDTTSTLFTNLSKEQHVLLTHGDSISTNSVAPSFKAIAHSTGDIVAAIERISWKQDEEKAVMFGVQFHPEVDLSVNGKEMIRNFLFHKKVGFSGNFTPIDREESCINEIRQIVNTGSNNSQQKKVLVLVSGGVDSTVCAALLNKAIGSDRVIALHIDNGFMRLDESKLVKESLQQLGLQLHVVNASDTFYNAKTVINNKETNHVLKLTVNPEEKRKIIGDTFMRVAEQVAIDLKLDSNSLFLAQGTLRPDLIESASSIASNKASAIKTHHNDTALVRQLREKGKVIEPLKDFHKDEVRQLGRRLGLPSALVDRQPFPGPGLAIRVICANKPFMTTEQEFVALNKFVGELVNFDPCATNEDNAHLRRKILSVIHSNSSCEEDKYEKDTQALKEMFPSTDEKDALHALLLPVQTVGVQGDGRTYSYIAAITSKGNKASAQIDWKRLFTFAKLIPKLCHNINRVVYVFGGAFSNSIITQITPTTLLPQVLDHLRIADNAVNQLLINHNLITKLSQVPIILFPIDFDGNQDAPTTKRSVAIRTFLTADFMTGVPANIPTDISFTVLDEMVQAVLQQTPNISRVVFDLTSKPPGTTEWE